MRLIDADKLIEEIYINAYACTNDEVNEILRKQLETNIYVIKEQPTAFDVDKVVGEIETLKLAANKMRKDVEGMEDMDFYDVELYERGREYAFDDVIEIVKAGGIDDIR